jgi:hypothetical protein
MSFVVSRGWACQGSAPEITASRGRPPSLIVRV